MMTLDLNRRAPFPEEEVKAGNFPLTMELMRPCLNILSVGDAVVIWDLVSCGVVVCAVCV